mgnify:CR=1 FL=1
MSQPNLYKVVWSTEHNSGELPDEYVGIETAIRAGREWQAEMVAIDDDPASAAEEYQWEGIRVSPPIPVHPQHEERPHEHDRQD